MNGIIKFYNTNKGYGFVIEDETKEEIFFHVTGLVDQKIMTDDVVSFDVEKTDLGKKAVNVYKR